MSERAPGLSWGHINLNVRDLDASIAFYEKLGFQVFLPSIPYLGWSSGVSAEPAPEPCTRALGLPDGTRARACILQLGDGFPKLDVTELRRDDPRPPLENGDRGLVRICLASRDLSADHARLSGQGVRFLAPPATAKDGLAEIAVCVDPDGALIELIQLHLERWLPPSTDD